MVPPSSRDLTRDSARAFDENDLRNFSLFIYGALRDRQAARPYLQARLDINPWENLQYYPVIFAYYRLPQDIERIVESASKAGVPRYAFGFDPGSARPLDRIALRDLTDGRLWRGNTHDGGAFFQQFSSANRVALRTPRLMMSGSYRIESNRLCINFGSVLLGLSDCGPVYAGETDGSYTWIALGDIYRFSPDN